MTTTPREAELLEKNERLEKENALLRQKIDLLIRRVFGAQSEKLDPAQLLMLLQGGPEGQEDLPGKPCDPGVVEAESGRSAAADFEPLPGRHRSRKPVMRIEQTGEMGSKTRRWHRA